MSYGPRLEKFRQKAMVLEGYLPQEWWNVVMDSMLLPRSVVVDGHTSPIPSVVSTDDDYGSSVITYDDG